MRLTLRTDERDEAPIEVLPGHSVLVGRQPAWSEVDDLVSAHGAARTVQTSSC